VQRAALCNRIHLVLNGQVGCYACHFDFKLPINSSGLPTSFHYLVPQDFPLWFIIIISSLPQQQIMAPQAPQRVDSGTESRRTTAISIRTPPAETQLQRRHHLVHLDAASATTAHMTLDAQWKIVHKTWSSKNKTQHAIGCKCNCIEVHGRQLIISHTAGVRRELRNQCIAARNGKPPWSTTEFAPAVCKIEHLDVFSSGIFAHKFSDKNPWEWTRKASSTLQDATEVYMVAVVIAQSNM